MRKLFVATATVAIFALLVTPAFAGNGKGGGKGGNQTAGTSSIKIEDYSELWLGGTVGFETNAVGLAGWEYPMVAVWCYQDVDGDGLETGGQTDDLVYAELRHPGDEPTLGGAASLWLTNGGSAECTAVLDAYGWKGGQESVRDLDSVGFHAAG